MENENKNATNNGQSGQHQKNRSRKHKSYFITPADAQNANNNAPQAQRPKEPSAAVEQPAQKNKGNNHNKPHHNNTHPQQGSADNTPKASAPQQNEQKPSAQQNQAKHNRNKNHRRRHNNDRPKDNQNVQPTGEPTSANIATEPQIKDAPAPVSQAPKKSADRLEKPAPKKLERLSDISDSEKYSDYEEFTYDQIYGNIDSNESTATYEATDTGEVNVVNDTAEPMVDVVGIRFKASGKTYYFAPKGVLLKTGSHAIVETARGLEYGEVALGNTKVKESETVPPLRPVIRKATEADVKHHAENKKKEDDAFRLCNEKIIEHELDMKLIDAQYTFDNSKLLFYFTSSGRVDFRDLVKDLAGVFRTRIELRQIGIRDEAKMVGGLGPCGRPLCCSIFLTDFGQVSIKMAKEQNLSLNSSKISGICGRLMCCLRYEHETYEYEIKRTPAVDTVVRTADGIGVVTEISPLTGTIKVRLNDSPETPPKSYKREEVNILKKKTNK